MSGKDLFEAMSYVDERFVDEAENKTLPKRVISPWIKVASMAACLCLIIFSLYNLQPYFNFGPTEGAGQVLEAIPESAVEDTLDQEIEKQSPAEAGAPKAPEMMVWIQELSDTGFIGTVQNNGGFTVFADGTKITVTIDPETDPDFDPDSYKIGDLVQVMYTQWDVVDQSIVASVLGIVEEPVYDEKG